MAADARNVCRNPSLAIFDLRAGGSSGYFLTDAPAGWRLWRIRRPIAATASPFVPPVIQYGEDVADTPAGARTAWPFAAAAEVATRQLQ